MRKLHFENKKRHFEKNVNQVDYKAGSVKNATGLAEDNVKDKIKSKRAGFTLVEMVIVVAILAILASVAFVKYSKVQQEAKLAADRTNATNIATAYILAENDGKEITTIKQLVDQKYLNVVPKPQSEKGDFELVKEGNEIKVKVGGKVFYPDFTNEAQKNPGS